MGFISYSLDFYYNELQKIESDNVTEETVYRAKQLLKMLDDLTDEGYMELNEKLEEAFQAVSRLQNYIKKNGAMPFEILHKAIEDVDIKYDSDDIELMEAIETVIAQAKKGNAICKDVFLEELVHFCEWIGYEEDTAYIFLLRDTLLPYIFYKEKYKSNVYPFLLGRKTLSVLSGKEGIDDEIRAFIIEALERGKCHDYNEFCNFVLPNIKKCILKYPQIERCLNELLSKIVEKRIIVIESGCSGTFPMLLKSLDNRVDIRMYTTYPYLLEIYGNKIYTPKYEENRMFETLYSQDLYFQFSDLRNGCFYVKKSQNKDVEEKSLTEIRTIIK